MSFSYNVEAGLPTDLDKVRRLIGDVTEENHLFHDEELLFFIGQEPNIYWAAASAALSKARELQQGGLEDEKVGETRIRYKRVDELLKLAQDLRSQRSTHMLPSALIYSADRDAILNNTGLLKGAVEVGMHDYPGTTSRSNPARED